MVSPYQMHAVRVSELQTNKKRNGFYAKHAAINIVTCQLIRILMVMIA
jgi:hypothetical protein